MTSTSINVGLSDTRRSSRVLRPPGGGHTDIFGEAPEPQRTGRRMVPNPNAAVIEEPVIPPTNAETSTQNGQEQAPPAEAPASTAPVPEPVPEPEPVQNSAPVNITTETAKSVPQQPQETQEPQKRVRVPPGGFSSKLW